MEEQKDAGKQENEEKKINEGESGKIENKKEDIGENEDFDITEIYPHTNYVLSLYS